MDPSRAELYLDPLLPLYVRRNTVSIARSSDEGVRALLVCIEGRLEIRGGSVDMELQAPGIARLKLAGSRSGVSIGGRRESESWLIVFGGRLLDELIVGTFGDPGYSRFLEELERSGPSPCGQFDQELSSGLIDLADELETRRPAYRVRARSLLTDSLLVIYRASLTTPELRNGDGMRLGSILDHIEINFADELSLQGLADIMGTSPSHFSRIFRAGVGIPLFEHINRTRIRKACLLLRNPKLQVTQIAFDVGYNSVSFFNRYFRRIMNLTPREYRRYLSQ